MKKSSLLLFPVCAGVAALGAQAHAAEFTKENNLTSMNLSGSWVGSPVAPPGAADTIIFNDIFTQTGNLGTGAPLSYLGLRVEGTTATGLITINNTTAANHIAPGTGGIDMSTAPRNLTIASVQVNADQTWTVGNVTGRLLTVGGTKLAGSGQLTLAGAGQLVIAGANTLTKGVIVSSGRMQSNNASGFGSSSITHQILSGGQAWASTAITVPANFEIAGTGWTETSGLLGAIRLSGGTHTGAITLKDNARITAHGSTGTLSGVIGDGGGNFQLELGNFNTAADSTITISGTSANTYGGGTLVTGAIVRGLKNGAFGTGPITVQSNGTVARDTRLQLEGATIDNDIFLSSNAETGFRGALHAAGGLTAVVNGTVTIDTGVGNGGHLAAENNTAAILRVMGPIHVAGAVSTPSVRIGTVELGGGGNYTALNHNQGTLRLAALGGINPGAALNGGSSGASVFDLNGINQTLSRFTSGSFETTITNDHPTDPATLTLTSSNNSAFRIFNPGTSALNIVKEGTGTLSVTGTSTGTAPGTVTINDGTLSVTGKLGGSATDVVLADGATLSGEGIIGGDLVLGSTTGVKLLADASTVGSLLVEGDVTVTGVLDITTTGELIPPTQLFQYTGTLNATLANFSAPRLRGPTFDLGTGTNSVVTLTPGAPVNLTWTGDEDNTWDAGSGTNWEDPSLTPDEFFDFDNVLFNDSAAGSGEIAISLPNGVTAGTITFDNSSKDFRITGPGNLGGGNLTKQGTGTLTLATPGGHSGWTDIEAGTLVFDFTNGNPAANTLDIQILSEATLKLVHDDGDFSFSRPIAGDGTVVINPHQSAGSTNARTVNWTGNNPTFTGPLLLAAPITGTSRIIGAQPSTLGSSTITVASGNQLFTAASQIYSNAITLSGDGFADSAGFLGALRLENGTIWSGAVTLTGTPGDSGGTNADARIGMFNGTATIDGAISGGDLRVAGYNSTASEDFVLSAANTFGDLIVEAHDTPDSGQVTAIIGNTGVGATNTTGTLGSGNVHLIGGAAGKVAALRIQRADGYTLQQDIIGAGNKANTVLIADVTGTGLSLGGRTVDIGAQVRLGGNADGAILNLDAGSTVNAGFFFLGNVTGNSSVLNQTGGTATASDHIRIGHWANETSVWNMDGGSLAITGVPASPFDGGPGGGTNEAPGMLYVGVDGQGIFNHNAGTVSAYGIVLDNRGNTAAGTNMTTGIDEYNLNGGTLTLNASGIRGNASTAFNFGGGSLVAAAPFTSTLPLNVTAPGSSIDTAGFVVTLQGGISGSGSLTLADSSLSGDGQVVFEPTGSVVVEADLNGVADVRMNGSGKLTLAGTNTYTGITEVWAGTLAITGSISSGLILDGGTLETGGSVTGNVNLSAFTPSAIRYTGTPLAVTGDVAINGVVEVDPLANGPLAAGTYPLVTFTGSLSGSISNVQLPSGFQALDYRQTFSFATTANSIDLVVTGNAGDLVWDGPGDWDLNNSTVWAGGEKFLLGDAATFDDTATSGTVNIVGNVSPKSVLVDNDTLAYTFGGTGSISGSTQLIKDGPGTLTINNANSFSGGALIKDGRLVAGIAGALGSGPIVISQGSLKFVPVLASPLGQTIIMGDSNSGTADTILEPPVNPTTSNDVLTLDANVVVSSDAPDSKAIIRYSGGTSGAAMRMNGTVTLQGRDLHLENTSDVNPNIRLWNMGARITGTGNVHIDVPGPGGTPRVRLLNTTNDWQGDLYVNSGHVQIGNGAGGTTTAIPDTADVFVATGATFALGAGDTIAGLFGSGDIRANLGTATNTITLTVGGNDASGIFDGQTLNLNGSTGGGNVAITKIGTGTQVMNGVCAHLGATNVNGGTFVINNSYAGAVTVGAAGTLGGNGTLASTLTATAAGAKVNPGTSTGTLTVNGTANLSTGGTLVIEVDDTTTPKNDKLVAVGNLNITDATLDVQATGTPGQPVYLIASYGALTGTFAVENVPAGYEVDYNYNSTNQIALVSTNPDYDLWAQSFGLDPNNNGAPEFDADDDGLLNRQEYAFGLPPNSGAPASPIVQHLDKTSGKFRYTRRNPDLTGLNYTIQTSTTLQAGSWANDNGAIQQVVQTAGDVQTVEVTLGGTPPAVPRFFVRVAADE